MKKSKSVVRIFTFSLIGMLLFAAAAAADLYRENNYNRHTGKPINWITQGWPPAVDEFRAADYEYGPAFVPPASRRIPSAD